MIQSSKDYILCLLGAVDSLCIIRAKTELEIRREKSSQAPTGYRLAP